MNFHNFVLVAMAMSERMHAKTYVYIEDRKTQGETGKASMYIYISIYTHIYIYICITYSYVYTARLK